VKLEISRAKSFAITSASESSKQNTSLGSAQLSDATAVPARKVVAQERIDEERIVVVAVLLLLLLLFLYQTGEVGRIIHSA
jgi:hypothetical protein